MFIVLQVNVLHRCEWYSIPFVEISVSTVIRNMVMKNTRHNVCCAFVSSISYIHTYRHYIPWIQSKSKMTVGYGTSNTNTKATEYIHI
jgi:hypothetical protein